MACCLRGLFRRRQQRPAPSLRGRPAIRREKGYAADSGYVYQYTYEGYRPASRSGRSGRDYVFRCTSAPPAHIAVTVFAPDESFAAWERDQSRNLNDVERYAIVKMHLFETFDSSPHLVADEVRDIDERDVDRHVETLDL